jgi:hypothetical protein
LTISFEGDDGDDVVGERCDSPDGSDRSEHQNLRRHQNQVAETGVHDNQTTKVRNMMLQYYLPFGKYKKKMILH